MVSMMNSMTGKVTMCRKDKPKPVTPIKKNDTRNCLTATGKGCNTCKPGFELEKYVPGRFRNCFKKYSIMPVPKPPTRPTGVDTTNCTSAVGTGCKTCKSGFKLAPWKKGVFTKCVAEPKKVEEPKKEEDDWADFGSWDSSWDTSSSSSSSSSESSSSESSSSESSEEWSSGWDDDWSSSSW